MTIALLTAFAVFWWSWSAYVVAQRTDDLRPRVLALARAQEIPGGGPGASALRERLFRVEALLIGARLFIVDASGTVLRSSAGTTLTELPIGRLGDPDADGVRAGTIETTGAAGTLLLVAAPVGGADGATAGAATDGATADDPAEAAEILVAVQSLQEVRAAQRGILTVALATAVAGIATAWVAGGLLARRSTAPLRRLEAAAERVTAGEWGAQVAEEGDAETVSLARSFNRMSTRVAAAYAAQKDFIGDVSHEIRTPLTTIRGFAEALLDGTATSPEQRTDAIGVIRDESVRMGEMAQTLLALAELDSGVVEVRREPVDPALLAHALDARFAATAGERGIRLAIDIARDAAPLGDTDRLIQAASTLLANALAYTPEAGEVLVRTEVRDGSWRLHVDDSGPGIPADRRERVFDRFARLDASRSSRSGGTGLGLPICRRLVALMGGTVGAHASPLGGARLTIALPTAAPPHDPTQRELNTRPT